MSRSPSPFPASHTHEEDNTTSNFDVVTVEEVRAAEISPDSPPALHGDMVEQEHAHPQPPARKLCVRHQRMADEGISLKLQQVCGLLCISPVSDLR